MRAFTTSREWIAHYLANAENQLPIPWEMGAQLTTVQADAIIQSLQAWQLGETSEGTQMTAAARRYAQQTGDADFMEVVKLFIAEEQRHGELLGRFLDLHGAPRIQQNWGDSIFRGLRHLLTSMECWTTVVIGVETMALVYYRAVMEASESPVLRTICRQILKDEVHHLRFQYERLAMMNAHRSLFSRLFISLFQRGLFTATAIAVWIGHHRALRAGGYPFGRFWSAVWERMEFHWQQMHQDKSRTRLANAGSESVANNSATVTDPWVSEGTQT